MRFSCGSEIGNKCAVGKSNLAPGHAVNPSVKPNIHAPLDEDLFGISSKTFTQFRQNDCARVYERDSQHFLTKIWIESQRLSNEVIQCRDCFHSGKAAAGDHKSK